MANILIVHTENIFGTDVLFSSYFKHYSSELLNASISMRNGLAANGFEERI